MKETSQKKEEKKRHRKEMNKKEEHGVAKSCEPGKRRRNQEFTWPYRTRTWYTTRNQRPHEIKNGVAENGVARGQKTKLKKSQLENKRESRKDDEKGVIKRKIMKIDKKTAVRGITS